MVNSQWSMVHLGEFLCPFFIGQFAWNYIFLTICKSKKRAAN